MFCVSPWSVFDTENYEEIEKEAITSLGGESGSIPSLSLLKEKDFGLFSRQWFHSWFNAPGNSGSFIVVLSQTIDSDNPREPESSKIKLYEGQDEGAALESFKVLKSFFKVLMPSEDTHYSVEQLQQLITNQGPLSSKELVLKLAHLDIPDPLSHPNLQEHLHSRDEDGNTLLHVAASHGSSKVIKTLSSLAAVDLKSVNSKGENAIFPAIKSEQLGALLTLLFEDFDPNSHIRESGDTALHVAACGGFLVGVKALILFGADVLATNSEGKTAIDSARSLPATKSVADCILTLQEIQLLDEKNDHVKDTPISSHSTGSASLRLLCLDGGGIRGLVEVVILTELDAIMRELDPSMSHLVDCFDFIAGTSTGSFVAASLVYQRLPPASLKKMYFRFKENVFSHEKPIKSSVSDKAAKEAFGLDQVLSAETSPKVMIATTIPEYEPPLQHLMCNYGKARDGQKGPHERKVWEACRASSAAPTYFVPFEDRFIDGGVMANNPTLDAMTEVVWLQEAAKQPLQLGIVVSLGTGLCPTSIDTPNIPHIDWWNPIDVWKAVQGVERLLQVMLSEITASSGVVVQRAKAWCQSLSCPYYRLSPEINPVKLDELDDKILVNMMYETLLYARAKQPVLREIALSLLRRKQ